MVISKKTIIFQGFRGGPTFSRGVQMLISIESHRTCDFPGGLPSPYPPLDPHMKVHLQMQVCFKIIHITVRADTFYALKMFKCCLKILHSGIILKVGT